VNLVGYCDPLTVAPGETIHFMVSSAHPAFRADIVRLIHGDPNPNGPGFKETEIATAVSGEYPGRVQPIVNGSHVLVPDTQALRLASSLTIQAWIFPTLPGEGIQGLLTKWNADAATGFGLVLDEQGALALWLGDGAGAVARISSGVPLRAGRWYFVAARFDVGSGQVTLVQEPVSAMPLDATNLRRDATTAIETLGQEPALLIMAGYADAEGGVGGHFNGKIDRPRLFARALSDAELDELKGEGAALALPDLVAAWDFSQEISSSRVVDVGPHALHGTAVNCPTRGVTGANWTGCEPSFLHAPTEYGAIHFHDDDLEDASWEPAVAFTVPDDFPTGIYALRLRGGEDEDHVPFFVRPRPGATTADLAFLVPTLTYLAYADEHTEFEPSTLFPFLDRDAHATEYRYIAENGLHSLYDTHHDGSGVCYASWKRPLVNLRPRAIFRIFGSPERFGADLYLVDWLEQKGFPYDVISDEILHAEGVGLLAPYRVVVTGTHPEYWTGPMLDALAAYLTGGGRVMYLGGNGFYWVTGIDPERPHVIEIRRWRGTESWEAEPGEVYLSTTAELGSLWRYRNRAPQKLLGVGFTAQGNDYSRPYARQAGSFDPRAAFVFEGIGDDEAIGDFPSLMLRHGAAGYEIDRLDVALGTPSHALLLASAAGFSDSYQHVIEEVLSTDDQQGGSVDPDVRADMVFFEGPNGGAVFSVGSIAWCGALSHNGYVNTVSRVTENVLRRFLAEEGFV
jgi:N,N-dimethylformamidase